MGVTDPDNADTGEEKSLMTHFLVIQTSFKLSHSMSNVVILTIYKMLDKNVHKGGDRATVVFLSDLRLRETELLDLIYYNSSSGDHNRLY